ncbi:Uncharacterised protein [Mycobacteroides abscessus subsp. abscessus]|uniref:hypothetical protein n=1 Tax=Mycobacteroides abscessus TaxID=36809 RepID=UPI000927AFCB|nr:hypothetical protein [Mycobacteroides abscessus]SID30785.1 Uncharacterised protein [Mycobacteroides abscessus subsp. abscessus]SID69849.1 Uncharacterised protein [Mycobacteroides abscessus subsp. abscessus]SKG37363.1 Uncharacterised protein [Mycobacteroides abscessus subsp. abscessus]SKQ81440.1 Uncharacterised protein [Mycobacteroides abscessus subsp. abscessus]
MRIRRGLCIVVAAAAMAGCGGAPTEKTPTTSTAQKPAILPQTSVDMEGWKAEILAASPEASPDMARMYELTVSNCDKTVDEFESMIAADTDGTMAIVRRGMRYVCPTRLERVNQAQSNNNQGSRDVDRACATSPDNRTPREQDLAAAAGC